MLFFLFSVDNDESLCLLLFIEFNFSYIYTVNQSETIVDMTFKVAIESNKLTIPDS